MFCSPPSWLHGMAWHPHAPPSPVLYLQAPASLLYPCMLCLCSLLFCHNPRNTSHTRQSTPKRKKKKKQPQTTSSAPSTAAASGTVPNHLLPKQNNQQARRLARNRADWRASPRPRRWFILPQIPIGLLLLLVDFRRDRAGWNARNAWQKEQLRPGRERARRRELEARGFVADDGGGAGERWPGR